MKDNHILAQSLNLIEVVDAKQQLTLTHSSRSFIHGGKKHLIFSQA
jgi:hypothetical protein